MKSARILGQEENLTAQEMNVLLQMQGYLEGEPGDYQVTEKGAPFAKEQDFHRGTGGYSWYNRNWTTRVWDESILDELDTSEEKKNEAREAVTMRRLEQSEARKEKEREICDDKETYIEENDADEFIPCDFGMWVRTFAVVGSMIGLAFAVPHVKRFWKKTVEPTCNRFWCKITGKDYLSPKTQETSEEDREH